MNTKFYFIALTMTIIWSFLPFSVSQASFVKRSCPRTDLSPLEAKFNSASTVQSAVESISNTGVDLVVIGEGHIYGEWLYYPQIVESFRQTDNGFNCFFVELAHEKFIDKMIKEYVKNGAQHMSRDLADEAIEKAREAAGLSSKLVGDLKVMGIPYAIIEVHLSGYKVIPVDTLIEQKSDFGIEFIKWLNSRDQFMATKIEENYKNGTCKRGVYPVGARHIVHKVWHEWDYYQRRTLRDLLNNESTTFANLVVLGNGVFGLSQLTREQGKCLDFSGLEEPIAYSRSGLESIESGDFSKFLDYDWHLIYPSSQ